MLKREENYAEVYGSFSWTMPDNFNIGTDVSDRWADGTNRPAIITEDMAERVRTYSFDDLSRLSNQLANALVAKGIKRGDRVGVIMDQSVETALSHIAILKIGAIAVPLLSLFGPEAIEYRLGHCGAKGLICDAGNVEKILEIKENLPSLKVILVANAECPEDLHDFWESLGKGSSTFSGAPTRPDDPAFIIYTSGTTGAPKAALHGHRMVLGHLPGVQFIASFFPQPDDLVWSPVDWAWIAGLGTVLLTSLHFGVPVVAHRMKKFDPERVYRLLAKHRVRNALFPPAALNMMRLASEQDAKWEHKLRTVIAGGQALGKEVFDWASNVMGVPISETYGQTEVHMVTGTCPEIMEVKPGSIGRPAPGRIVEILDPSGNPVGPGVVGEVAVRRPDPVIFLEYYRDPEATARKLKGQWCMTGDMMRKDEDGYFWFVGRDDDMIKSSGYRIGPDEVEACLRKHPAVHMAGVIGSPDPVRGSIVKAYIHLKRGVDPSAAGLAEDIQNFVKARLAAYEYPREIEFVEQLPVGPTGKLLRKELKQKDVESKLNK